MEFSVFTVTKDDNDRRVDRIARRFLPKESLSGIYRLLRKGLIRVDGKKIPPDHHVKEGNILNIAPNLLDSIRSTTISPNKSLIPDTLLETSDLLFINKPSGIPVHGIGGLDQLIPQTLASNSSLSFKTGPLHRLDVDTTGILTFSRSLEGARWFSQCVRDRIFYKYYVGILEGCLEINSQWQDKSDDGKEMITIAKPLCVSKNTLFPLTLVKFQIITGRKHQIRIQSSLHGYPLTGDRRYGCVKKNDTYFLHALEIIFPDERLKCVPKRLLAPFPVRFIDKVNETFGQDVLAYIERGELY